MRLAIQPPLLKHASGPVPCRRELPGPDAFDALQQGCFEGRPAEDFQHGLFALPGSPEFSVDGLLHTSHALLEEFKIMADRVVGASLCACLDPLFQYFDAFL